MTKTTPRASKRVVIPAIMAAALVVTISFGYATSANNAIVEVTGIIDKGVEAGCVVLIGEDGKTYELHDLEGLRPLIGSRVTVRGTLLTDRASFCMQGAALKVFEYSVLSQGGQVTDYISLIDALRGTGVTVEPAGHVDQPIFSVGGQVINLNDERVQVFEYATPSGADAEAMLISPDGREIGTTMVTWVDSPHFYRAGRVIVLYVGESATVISSLETALGPQFAG